MKSSMFVLCAIGLLSRGAAAQQMDIRDFVQQIFIHGVPYEQASQYDSSVVPRLLEMLANPEERTYWTNIVGVLGIIGDERALEPLIAFAREGTGTLPAEHYLAKSSVPLALGYLVYKTGSQRAVNYLRQSINPSTWNRRDVAWTSPYHATREERNIQLSTMAIMGLALSGHRDAGAALRSLLRPDPAQAAFQALVRDVVTEALSVHETVAAEGLGAYYRSRNRSR